MNFTKAVWLLIACLISPPSFAYIPDFWMIMSRTAENHGRGYYYFEQDVTFPHGTDPLVVREHWWVDDDGEDMRLTVTGRKELKNQIRLTFLYSDGRRYFVDENGTRRVTKLSDDWFEDFFFFRYSKRIKPRMFSQKMISKDALEKQEEPEKLEDINNEPEGFVHLGRVNGSVVYAIGEQTPPQDDPLPGLWVEQDGFNVFKVRLKSEVEVVGKKYTRYSRKFYFPQIRVVSWGDNRAVMNVLRMKSYGYEHRYDKKFEPKSLNHEKNSQLARKLPSDDIIEEFYLRFR